MEFVTVLYTIGMFENKIIKKKKQFGVNLLVEGGVSIETKFYLQPLGVR